MKTQLVQLESHDDLISIRDKMSWAKTPRILLAWPRDTQVDVRPLDLQLLRRHAISLGAELGLVTRDGEIRAAARQMNLPVFYSPGEAQRRPWPARKPARQQRRFARLDLRAIRARLPGVELFETSHQPGTRLAIFAAGVLAVLAVVMVFIPSAEINLTAPTQAQYITIAVSAQTDATKIALSGVIPARELVFVLDESDSMPASGRVLAPDQAAQGRVAFTNLTMMKVQIPAETVLLTNTDPPLRFATLAETDVPAGNGAVVHAFVRALAPGSSGNVPADAIVDFDGPLRLSVSVTNEARISGGTDITASIPTDSDRQTLREGLLTRIKNHAKTRFPARLQNGDIPFPSSFVFSKVVAETYTPGPDERGSKLSLTMQAEFHVYYAAAADLKQLAARVLDASLPAGYEVLDETLTVKATSPLFGGADGNARWHMQATRTLRARIDPAQVVYLVQGKTAGYAGSLLQETFGLQSAPQISIQPFFWPWLPALPFRISVAG